MLSFQFSQGRDFPQRRYFAALGHNYTHNPEMPSGEKLAGFVRESLDMEGIKVPANHVDLTNHAEHGDVSALVKRQYDKQADAFEEALYNLSSSPISYEYVIARAAAVMVEHDSDYLKRGRPGEKEDPYESLYREYVLLGRKVGSATFSAILSDMRSTSQDTKELALLWESKHPGKSFYMVNQ